jgi:hypothetical protein
MGLTQSTISPTVKAEAPVVTNVLHTVPVEVEPKVQEPSKVAEVQEPKASEVQESKPVKEEVVEDENKKLLDEKASEVFERAVEPTGNKIEVQPVDVAESADVVKKSKKNKKNKNKGDKV